MTECCEKAESDLAACQQERDEWQRLARASGAKHVSVSEKLVATSDRLEQAEADLDAMRAQVEARVSVVVAAVFREFGVHDEDDNAREQMAAAVRAALASVPSHEEPPSVDAVDPHAQHRER